MFENITVTDIGRVFTVFSPKGRIARIENRESYGLSFCTDGRITYTHKGKKAVSERSCAVILPKGQAYTLFGEKTGSFPIINFECEEQLCDTVISLPIQNTEAYIKDFEKLRSLSLFEGGRAEMMSVFYHMLYRLSSQDTSQKTIMPAIKYLEQNYGNPDLTNTELARQCHISEVYFRRLFTECYRVTPKQFLIDIRINKAKQLLTDGVLKISAIAASCGFTNQYHFCRLFKEKTGLTPTEYMKQNKIYKI